MKRATAIRPHVKSTGKPTINRSLYQYIALLGIILFGAAIGAVFARNAGLAQNGVFGGGLFMCDITSPDTLSRGFGGILLSAFFAPALLLCVAYIMGLCALGFPAELLVLFSQGFLNGLSMCVIYSRYGLKGLAICSLFILPQAVLTSLATVVACREGIRFSLEMSAQIFKPDSQKALLRNFKIYCGKYVFCFIMVAFAALIETLAVLFFARLFY